MTKIFEGKNIHQRFNVSRIKRMIYGGSFFSPDTRMDSLRDIVMSAFARPSSYFSHGIPVGEKPSGFKFRYGIE